MIQTAAAGQLPLRSQSSRRKRLGAGTASESRPSVNRPSRLENVSRPRDHETGNRYSENDDVNFLVHELVFRIDRDIDLLARKAATAVDGSLTGISNV